MKDVKFLLVDDNQGFRQLLKILLEEIGAEQICLASNYEDGWNAYLSYDPDICLLDVCLGHPSQDGVDLAKAIRRRDSRIPIVFLTSHYQDYVYERARATRPMSFMNKDLSSLKLLQVIEPIILNLKASRKSQEPRRAAQGFSPVNRVHYGTPPPLFFKVGDTYKAIDVSKVSYFFSKDRMTYARVGARNFPTNVQLKALATTMQPRFLRIHKRYLVNVDAIESILAKDGKVKIGEEFLPIGYAYRKEFMDSLFLMK